MSNVIYVDFRKDDELNLEEGKIPDFLQDVFNDMDKDVTDFYKAISDVMTKKDLEE